MVYGKVYYCKYEHRPREHIARRASGKAESRSLLEDDDGTVCLEGLFDLLSIFLGDAFFEHLWQRLDKLFRLNPIEQIQF